MPGESRCDAEIDFDAEDTIPTKHRQPRKYTSDTLDPARMARREAWVKFYGYANSKWNGDIKQLGKVADDMLAEYDKRVESRKL